MSTPIQDTPAPIWVKVSLVSVRNPLLAPLTDGSEGRVEFYELGAYVAGTYCSRPGRVQPMGICNCLS